MPLCQHSPLPVFPGDGEQAQPGQGQQREPETFPRLGPVVPPLLVREPLLVFTQHGFQFEKPVCPDCPSAQHEPAGGHQHHREILIVNKYQWLLGSWRVGIKFCV